MSSNNFEILTLNKPNILDFAEERNTLLKKAKKEWVFFVDTDEKPSKELLDEIDGILNNKNVEKQFNGFYVKRKNYILNEYVGTDKIIRLGRREEGNWVRKVHEIWKIEGKVGTLKNTLTHNTAGSLNEYIRKINYYSTLHAEENLLSGKRSNIIKIIFFPTVKFIQSIIQGRSVIVSMLQSFHSFLAWSKEWKLQNS